MTYRLNKVPSFYHSFYFTTLLIFYALIALTHVIQTCFMTDARRFITSLVIHISHHYSPFLFSQMSFLIIVAFG